MNTSSVLTPSCKWRRVESPWHHNQRHILWVLPRNGPTVEDLHLLKQIVSIVFFHYCRLAFVGRSWGHLILDHVSPGGRHKRILVYTLLLDAVRTSKINSSWREICTLLCVWSISAAYLAFNRTCIMNWLPCHGYSWAKSVTMTFISNMDSFSQSNYIQEWVTRKP